MEGGIPSISEGTYIKGCPGPFTDGYVRAGGRLQVFGRARMRDSRGVLLCLGGSMKWTVYVLNVGGRDLFPVKVGRVRARQMEYIDFIWAKALASGKYQLQEVVAGSLEELEGRTPHALTPGALAVDEAGSSWVFVGTGWVPVAAPRELAEARPPGGGSAR
jgi:hypothetical protein